MERYAHNIQEKSTHFGACQANVHHPPSIASDVFSLCIVITCVSSLCSASGVLYQLPYDVEGLLCHDDHMLGVRLVHIHM